MKSYLLYDLGELGLFDILFSEDFKPVEWNEAKSIAKKIGSGFRLPLDFELEKLFKSSLFRGVLKNASYWSGTETAHSRARSQIYRDGGDWRSYWYQNPGDVESKDAINYFFLIRLSKKKECSSTSKHQNT